MVRCSFWPFTNTTRYTFVPLLELFELLAAAPDEADGSDLESWRLVVEPPLLWSGVRLLLLPWERLLLEELVL